MMHNVLIHIPHASTNIPSFAKNEWDLSEVEIKEELSILTDHRIDLLFQNDLIPILRFPYSRLFCDVERFYDSSLEEMEKYGMGFVYTKRVNQTLFFRPSNFYKQMVYEYYYLPFHQEIDHKVSLIHQSFSHCLFFDVHSFSDKLIKSLFGVVETPDICLGYHKDFVNYQLLQDTKNYFEQCGYKVCLNSPYSGSFYPDICLEDNNIKVYSLMLEFNQRIYQTSKQFERLRFEILDYLMFIMEKYAEKNEEINV